MSNSKGSVSGPHNKHHVLFYGLSTCVWCKKTRKFLEEQGIAFDFTYLDLLNEQEREETKKKVQEWNPATSFPTLVIDNERCLVGFRPEEIKKALGL